MSVSRMQLLTGLGAFVVSLVLLALYGLVVFISLPGGIDHTESFIAILAVGLLFTVLIVSHIVYGRILIAAAHGKRFGI